jgi:anti-sigma28 factor (negative regulator of flagellin synthesis)
MRGRAATVDEVRMMAHTLPHTLHISPHEQLQQMFAKAAGRFGRQVRTIAWPDPEMAPARPATVTRMRAQVRAGEYRIDPSVVADAIVDRVGATSLHA